MNIHDYYMELAYKEALKGVGIVSPNPPVGAVIVKNGKIIGRGAHLEYGKNHAEVNAFENCSESPEGADIYVTLEPCNHFGKTPPCSHRIVKEKIGRVFIGSIDASDKVNGKGISYIRENGIEVTTGILQEKTDRLYEMFFHYSKYKMPFVLLKCGISLDGCICAEGGDSKWITSSKSREYVHKLRSEYDAVMVGTGTAMADNPKLNVRMVNGRNPYRVILDRNLKLPLDYNVYSDELIDKTIVFTSKESSREKREELISRNIKVIEVETDNGSLNMNHVLKELGKMNILSVLVEGGSKLTSSLLKEKFINRVNLFTAPIILGSKNTFSGLLGITEVSNAVKVNEMQVKKVDRDIFIDGKLSYSNN